MTKPTQEPWNVRQRMGLLTEADVAATLGLSSTDTLATWRSKKIGPPSIKLGKQVFYNIQELANWVGQQAQQQRESGDQKHAAKVSSTQDVVDELKRKYTDDPELGQAA